MKIVAMIPTFNERENIIPLIKEIISLPRPETEVLVVDDDSGDGTWRVVQDFAASTESVGRVHLLHRLEKRGRGYAGADGFKYAIDKMGADIVVEMDGDGSHSPSYIPLMVDAILIGGADIVIGSRYIPGGKDIERSFVRKMVSAFARKYLSFILGLKVCDPTSGFRAFTRKALESFVGKLKSSDPFIVTEVLFYAAKNSLVVKEIPIEFKERLSGKSKLKPATLLKYLVKVWKLKFESD